jgi:ABC-2 type transport system permease protein
MRNVWVVMSREYVQRVRRKSFVLSTIAVPLIMIVVLVIPALMGAREADAERRIVVVDRTGILSEGLVARLATGGFEVEVVPPGSAREAGALLEASAGGIAGVLELDGTTLERGAARWTGRNPPTTLRGLGIRQAIAQSALEVRLGGTDAGTDVSALLAGGSLEVVSIGPGASEPTDRAAGMAAGFVGSFLLYFVLLVYGTMVMRAVLEEKTGRIVEIIVSSMRPSELMLGKVVGVGAVGLTQLAIWLVSGALILALGIPALVTALPDGEILSEIRAGLPGAGVAVYFVACFLLGYFMYASLFAAVGAMCSTEEEAQQLQFPVVTLVVIPVIFLMPVLDRPEAPLSVALSLFPFFSPILMFARLAAGAAGWLEASLALVLMVATLLGTASVAGRIYRVGILMQGKRPTLPEILRWLREA